jgi:hypothetical protein
VRTLTTALLLLVLAAPAGADRSRPPTHKTFVWFRDEIDASFRSCHKVTEYAPRLGYSTRTLNRLARENTGLSAKELTSASCSRRGGPLRTGRTPWRGSPRTSASMTRRTSRRTSTSAPA